MTHKSLRHFEAPSVYYTIFRNNLKDLEILIAAYSPLLSENHVFLLQLKMWLIEGLNRLPYKGECKDILWKKIQLIRELVQVMSKFEAPYSYINGILHLELTDTIIQKLYGLFSSKMEDINQAQVEPMALIDEAKRAVEIAEKVFKNEDAKSIDHCLKMKVCDLKVSLMSFS